MPTDTDYCIDLNVDIGEGFGPWRLGQDAAVLEWVTSANIACGCHAGDPDVMAETVQLALAHGVALGAHPSLPDRQGFGRRTMGLTPKELEHLVLYQLGALEAFVRTAGGHLAHVKPHGALYHQAAADLEQAQAIATAVRAFDPSLTLIGPPGSALLHAAAAAGLGYACEGFADRRYEPDGTLTPRRHPQALIQDPAEALSQALRLIVQGEVIARDGTLVKLHVDTLCIHGDSPQAPAYARALRQGLGAQGIGFRPVAGPRARRP